MNAPIALLLPLLLAASAAAAPKAAAKKEKAPKPLSKEEAASEAAFDPLSNAKEYGVSEQRMKKLEEKCKTDFRDPLCAKRREAKKAQAKKKAKN